MRPVAVVCYICGREFGTRSIGIHEPQCIKKWENQNNKLPKGKRQPRPVKPKEFDQPISNDPKIRAQQMEQMNMASNAAASENLVSCKNCARTFNPNRIEAHEKICTKLKMTPAAQLKSKSGFYGQRVVVVDGEQVEVAQELKKEKTFASNTLVRNEKSTPSMGTNILQSKVGNQISKNIGGPLQTLPCQFCGKAISHNAINIHIKKCQKRPATADQTTNTASCSFCDKKFAAHAMSVHEKNCSAKPKHVTPTKPRQSMPTGEPKAVPVKQKSRQSFPPDKVALPQISAPSAPSPEPYQRYSPRPSSADNRRRVPAPPERLNTTLDPRLLSNYTEVEVDLVLGVDPSLVLNCMVCGLIVLKSKLNTHYHNFCQKSNMSRSVTIPPSGSPRPSPVEEDLKQENGVQFTTNALSSPTQIGGEGTVIGKVVTGRFVPCINCGKSFTVRSLVIHQKQCMK